MTLGIVQEAFGLGSNLLRLENTGTTRLAGSHLLSAGDCPPR